MRRIIPNCTSLILGLDCIGEKAHNWNRFNHIMMMDKVLRVSMVQIIMCWVLKQAPHYSRV